MIDFALVTKAPDKDAPSKRVGFPKNFSDCFQGMINKQNAGQGLKA